MMYLAASLIIFLVFSLFHVILHRILAAKGLLTMKTGLIYLPGLILNIYINFQLSPTASQSIWSLPIPFSGIVFYLLMNATLLIFYAHPAMNFLSPSTIILRLLEGKKMTYTELTNHFSDNMLIDSRLKDLEKHALIQWEQKKVKVTTKGIRIVRFRENFRKIFGWRKEHDG